MIKTLHPGFEFRRTTRAFCEGHDRSEIIVERWKSLEAFLLQMIGHGDDPLSLRIIEMCSVPDRGELVLDELPALFPIGGFQDLGHLLKESGGIGGQRIVLGDHRTGNEPDQQA